MLTFHDISEGWGAWVLVVDGVKLGESFCDECGDLLAPVSEDDSTHTDCPKCGERIPAGDWTPNKSDLEKLYAERT